MPSTKSAKTKRARSSAEPFVEPDPKKLSFVPEVRETVSMITRAICDGDIALTQELLLRNPDQLDPLLVGPDGDTPLTLAVREDRPEMVALLLQLRCNPNATGYTYEDTPLMIAIEKRNHAIIRELLRPEHHTNLNQLTWLETPLTLSNHIGDFKVFTELLKAGADPNHKNSCNETPLIHAIQRSDAPHYVAALLDAGASLEEKGSRHGSLREETALSMACGDGNLKNVALLLEAAADVNATDTVGRNILLRTVHFTHACQRPQNLPLIRLLLWHGANVQMRCHPGWCGGSSARDYVQEKNLLGTAYIFSVFKKATSKLAKATLLLREDDVINILREHYAQHGFKPFLSPKDAELCRPTTEYMILRIMKSLQTELVGAVITELGLRSFFARGVLQLMLDYFACCEWEGDVVAHQLWLEE